MFLNSEFATCFTGTIDRLLIFLTGVHGDSLTILQSPEFVSFQKGDWPVSGEKIPDLVALTMGFSVQEVRFYPGC